MRALLLCTLLFVWGCQPSLDFTEDETSTNPLFTFSGELDGSPFTSQAGTNNNYMLTAVKQDDRFVYESTAALQPLNCNNCPNSWEFIIRDHAVLEPEAPMLPDSTFQEKNYPFFRSFGQNLYRLQLQNQSFPGLGNQLLASQWEVHDSSGQLIHQSQNAAPELLMPQGAYRVKLTAYFTNGCNNNLEKWVQVAPVNTQCAADFHYTLLNNNNEIQLNAIGISLTAPFTVQWQINGTTFTGSQVNIPVIALGTGGVNVVRMTAFNSSCTTEVVKQVTNNPVAFCTVNFRVNSSAFNDPIQTGTLRINYRRADGKLFSSAFGDQPISANFQVNDVASFANSPQGTPVKQIKGTVQCTLFSADGSEQMEITNGAFNLAFPYKP